MGEYDIKASNEHSWSCWIGRGKRQTRTGRGVGRSSLSPEEYEGRNILLIVPDATRTAPVGLLFRLLHQRLAAVTRSLDVLIALGTHPPMSEQAICRRLEMLRDRT